MARHQSENQAVARWTGLGNTDGCIGIENPQNTPIRPKGAELFCFMRTQLHFSVSPRQLQRNIVGDVFGHQTVWTQKIDSASKPYHKNGGAFADQ